MGFFEQSMQLLIDASYKQGGTLEVQDIADFIKFLREHEQDAHVPFMGQNGSGKSIAAWIVNKRVGRFDLKKNMIFPYHPVQHLIQQITQRQGTSFQIDELGNFFPYKLSMSYDQIALFNAIEVARSNRNSFIGCTRDILRINNNYRNGKAQLLIWILDRNDKGSLAVVLLGNPLFETEDKFMVSLIRPSYSLNDITQQIEKLPTFIGYLFFDDYHKYITDEEMNEYKRLKAKGMQAVSDQHQQRLNVRQAKENMLLKKFGDSQNQSRMSQWE